MNYDQTPIADNYDEEKRKATDDYANQLSKDMEVSRPFMFF